MKLFTFSLFILMLSSAYSQKDCIQRFKDIESSARGNYAEASVRLDSLGKACKHKLPIQKADTLALIFHKQGVYHYILKEYESAISAYHESLDIRLNDPNINPVLIGHSHLNLAKAFKKLRNYTMAKSHLQIAFDTLILHSNYKRSAETCHELALVLWELRDFYPALDFAEQAHSYYQKAKPSRSIKKSTAAILLLRGVLHAELKELSKAQNFYYQAKNSYQELGLDFQVSKCWNNIAEIYYQYGVPELALEAYESALQILEEADQLESAEAGQIQNGMGVCLMNMRQIDEAMNLFVKAMETSEKIYPQKDHPDIAIIQENLGDLFLKKAEKASERIRFGYINAAISFYGRAIKILMPELDWMVNLHPNDRQEVPIISNSTLVTGDYGMLLRLLHAQANAISGLYWVDKTNFLLHYAPDFSLEPIKEKAINCYKAADKILFRMRREQLNVNSHLYWVDKGKALYESAINFCFKTGRLRDALYFAERSKASILLEGIKNKQFTLQNSTYKEVLALENQLKIEVFAAEQRLRDAINSGTSAERALELKNSLTQKRIALHQFVESLRNEFPEYHSATFDEAESASRIAPEELGPTAAGRAKTLVQFFEGKTQSFVFFLQSDSSWMDTITWKPKSLNAFIQMVHTPSHAYTKDGLKTFQKLGYELYKDLLWLLDKKKITGNLIIIPDGSLQRLPFEALVRNDKKVNSFQELPYLVKDFSCSYSYSISVLKQSGYASDKKFSSFYGKPKKSWGILGMAPVEFPSQSGFSSLPQSRTEVTEIVGKWSGKALLEEKANLKNFRKYLSSFKVLHFATHAYASTNEDKPPFIAFADTLLYLPQIYGLETDAHMIVLSACQTLEGKDYRGEGIMSLTRAFRFLGIPSIVASLWQAEEKSTKMLMVDFYKGLGEGLEKDEALREAKLAYIKSGENAYPFYWAHVVHRGSSFPIQIAPERNYFLLFLLGGIILLAIGGLIMRRSR